ncbi:hypothetical protein [Texcoconibacillus texcoconensis]
MVKEGVPLNQIQRQLGHTSIMTTTIYTNQTIDDRRNSLDNVFKNR